MDVVLSNLKSSTYRDVLASAGVAALGAARDPRQIGRLKALAVAPNAYGARVSAWRALIDLAPAEPSVIPWLCERVDDPDERITLAAVSMLGHSEDERTIPTLERLAKKSGNPRVRVYAEEALTRVRAGGKKAEIK